MLRAFIKQPDGHVSHDTSAEALSAALRDKETVFWLDMVKPTDEEYALLDDVFGFHPLAIEDTLNYMQRPKIESYRHVGDACTEGYFYMVFHGPDLETFRQRLRTKELDLFVSERYLVTVHEEVMKSVEAVIQRAEADASRVLDRGIDVLLYNILDHMVDHYTPILDYLQDTLDDLEDRALTDPTPGVLTEIAMKKRELLNLRRIVGPQREVVAQLTRGDVPFIREGTRVYLRDVQDHLIRVVESVELFRDLVLGARDIYLSSISNNLNHIMKVLTIITVVALPMTVVTSFFGMNFDGDPNSGVPVWRWFLNTTGGLLLAMVIIGLMIAGLLWMFWRKGWVGTTHRTVHEREERLHGRTKREAAADVAAASARLADAAHAGSAGSNGSEQGASAGAQPTTRQV
jgi:magnesium transporter